MEIREERKTSIGNTVVSGTDTVWQSTITWGLWMKARGMKKEVVVCRSSLSLAMDESRKNYASIKFEE